PLGEDREVRVLAADVRGAAAAGLRIGAHLDRQRIVDALADDVAKLVGRQQRLAALFDLHLAVGVANGDFEVGGGDREPVVGGGELHALEDRLSGAGGDDVAGDGQRLELRPSVTDHFHGRQPFRDRRARSIQRTPVLFSPLVPKARAGGRAGTLTLFLSDTTL